MPVKRRKRTNLPNLHNELVELVKEDREKKKSQLTIARLLFYAVLLAPGIALLAVASTTKANTVEQRAVIRAIEEHNPVYSATRIHYEPKMTVTFCDDPDQCNAASTSGGPEVQVVGKLRQLVFYEELKVGNVVTIHVRKTTDEMFYRPQNNTGEIVGGVILLILGLLCIWWTWPKSEDSSQA